MRFQIDWKVIEVINGPGEHDDGVRDGDRRVAASGSIEKEGESAAALRKALTEALRGPFPEHGVGPTYNIDRFYDIEITAL